MTLLQWPLLNYATNHNNPKRVKTTQNEPKMNQNDTKQPTVRPRLTQNKPKRP